MNRFAKKSLHFGQVLCFEVLEKYRQLQDRNKSKLADMAAANESGNGIMGYNSSNSNDTTGCPDG